jgi:hypothetical protein
VHYQRKKIKAQEQVIKGKKTAQVKAVFWLNCFQKIAGERNE